MALYAHRPPRVALYGIGQFGQHVARLCVEKSWPIVAAFNRAGAKVGEDLGRVCGLERELGIAIQDCDTADYATLDADIGIVTVASALKANLASYRRLLNAGLNVLCHGGESYFPYGNDPVLAAEIDALAKRNNVTFSGGGIWDMSRIWAGILTAGPCAEIRSLFHSSITDVKRQVVTPRQALQVGIGLTVQEFRDKGYDKAAIATSYKTILEHVLFALGYTIAQSQVRIEPVVYDAPVPSALMGGDIAAGLCVGSRILPEVVTREGVTAVAAIDLRLLKEGEVEHMYWSVEGRPRSSVRTERNDSALASACSLFNRIPDVIAAPPGIVLVSQMGPLKHSALA